MIDSGDTVRCRIAGVDVFVLNLPLSFRRNLAKGSLPHGGDDPWLGNPVLVRLKDDQGRTGYGRLRPVNPVYGESTESIAAAIHRYYGPELLGADALATDAISERLEAVLPHNPNALAIVDMALHDLAARALGIPVHALLGGSPSPIPLDWSISLGSLDAMAAEASRAVAEFGVRTLSLKVGPGANWRQDAEKFRAIRDAVGEDIEIGIDANESYEWASATAIAKALEADGLAYFEQPLYRHGLDELAELRRKIGIPILLDETVHTPNDAYRAVKAGAGDCLVIKLARSGGLVRCRQISAIARAAGFAYTVGGNAQGNLLEAAAYAHLWASLPNPSFAAEFILGLGVVDPDPLARPRDGLQINDGKVEVPRGPGLGIEVDEAAVRDHTIAHHSLSRQTV